MTATLMPPLSRSFGDSGTDAPDPWIRVAPRRDGARLVRNALRVARYRCSDDDLLAGFIPAFSQDPDLDIAVDETVAQFWDS